MHPSLLLRQRNDVSQLPAIEQAGTYSTIETSKMEIVMGIGDMIGQAAGALGGGFDFEAKMEEMGVDASMLEGLDVEKAKALIAEKGLDLSMLDGLGLNIEDLLGKFTGKS